MTEKEFREKVLALQNLMYGMAVKSGLPCEDAADAVQETQLRLWRRRQSLPADRQELRRYCLVSMRNACIEWYRRHHDENRLDEVPDPPDIETDTVEFADTRHKIESLIDTLPAGQRVALRMSGFAGMETAEIAEATGQTEGNVRQLLSRGRKRLKELWMRYEI